MNKTDFIKNISFQLCSVPDSEGLVLELSKEDEAAFLEIRVDSDDIQWVRFFSSEDHIALTLDDVQKALDIAKKEVVNIPLE